MLPKTVMLDLPEDQHRVVNTIIQNLGPILKKKYPYFFITGSEILIIDEISMVSVSLFTFISNLFASILKHLET